jgi:hypothetical protein
MPIEIKELYIRIAVDSNNVQPQSSSARRVQDTDEKESLVAECVDKVLQILYDKRER